MKKIMTISISSLGLTLLLTGTMLKGEITAEQAVYEPHHGGIYYPLTTTDKTTVINEPTNSKKDTTLPAITVSIKNNTDATIKGKIVVKKDATKEWKKNISIKAHGTLNQKNVPQYAWYTKEGTSWNVKNTSQGGTVEITTPSQQTFHFGSMSGDIEINSEDLNVQTENQPKMMFSGSKKPSKKTNK